MIQVTSREFRDKQASLFDLADAGEDIIIKRGKKRSYALVPIDDSDFVLSPEAEERIERSRQQYKNGETVACETKKDLHRFLESL